jgi:hypothetical protein
MFPNHDHHFVWLLAYLKTTFIEVILLTMVYRPTTYGILTHSPWNIEPTTVFRFEMRGGQNTL